MKKKKRVENNFDVGFFRVKPSQIRAGLKRPRNLQDFDILDFLVILILEPMFLILVPAGRTQNIFPICGWFFELVAKSLLLNSYMCVRAYQMTSFCCFLIILHLPCVQRFLCFGVLTLKEIFIRIFVQCRWLIQWMVLFVITEGVWPNETCPSKRNNTNKI